MKTLLLKLNLVLMIVFFATTANANNFNGVINPPENDLIENAINIALGPVFYSEDDVNFSEATNTGDGGQQNCPTALPAIWYKFTATQSGLVNAQINPGTNAAVIFYSAPNENVTDGSELTYINSQDNPCDYNQSATIEVVEGNTYYIYMTNEITANVTIYSSNAFAIPENDLITNATDLGLESVPFVDPDVHFIMATNTDDDGQAGCDSGSTPAIWYKFTATSNGQVDAYVEENGEINAIIFFTADDLNATTGADLTWVDIPTNICGASNNSSIEATAGTSYYILAGSLAPYISVGIDLSMVLGTQNNILEDFSFYPNPVSNDLTFNSRSIIDEISIMNIMGQEVYSEKINSSSNSINIAHLIQGMYIMNVTSEGASASYKLIKK